MKKYLLELIDRDLNKLESAINFNQFKLNNLTDEKWRKEFTAIVDKLTKKKTQIEKYRAKAEAMF